MLGRADQPDACAARRSDCRTLRGPRLRAINRLEDLSIKPLGHGSGPLPAGALNAVLTVLYSFLTICLSGRIDRQHLDGRRRYVVTQPQFTRQQSTALDSAETSQSALLTAQERLMVALRRPQPTRERKWASAVSIALVDALAALRAYLLDVDDGLYREIALDAPWAIPRLRQLRAQLSRIESELVDLQIEAARVEAGDTQGLGAIRGGVEFTLLSLRDALSKETDLIFERFRDQGALD